MTSVPSEEETGNPIDDVAETEKFEFGKGYDLTYFKDIREKYRGKRKARRRTAQGLVEIPSYPTRPALWLDFKSPKEPAAPDVHPFTAFNLKQPSKMEWTILRCLHPKMYRNGPLTSVGMGILQIQADVESDFLDEDTFAYDIENGIEDLLLDNIQEDGDEENEAYEEDSEEETADYQDYSDEETNDYQDYADEDNEGNN
ncbi:hypothetical protein OUZ56_010623 [Daphnia magna]|uniref:DNA-directed RNA polymerase III subunit n=1 Tax=Daphnia magna TaxID=35525 RepID=A0ABR0AJ88_9CRUS|nr:hypothetical protein OUZ56_010623 [Daphnia magna]